MSALTPGVAAVIPSSAARLIRTAEENEWQTSAVFGAAGSKGRTADAWVVGLEAHTAAGEVSLLLYWERGPKGFRYVAKESRGVQGGVKLADMQLKTVNTLVEESEVTEEFAYGECGCENPEEIDNPRVCIEHAVCPDRFDVRFGWGAEVTRNGDLAGWNEDGGTGGHYSLTVEPVEGQTELTLADVIPAAVRAANIPGVPEPTDVGDCNVRVADGWNGYCEAYGVRLYLVGTRRDGRLMCAEHAAERAGVPLSTLSVLAMDAEEREYAADLIEDNRQHRVLRGAEEWAEARERDGRTISHAFEGWAEKHWTGDDYAAAYVAWLHTTGHAADPCHAWAVAHPVDRVQQAAVRVEAARGELATAHALHVSAQRYGNRDSMYRALDRLHAAHATVATAAAEHAAETAVAAEKSAPHEPAPAAVAARYRFGLPTGELSGRAVHVDEYAAGRILESGLHWYAVTPGHRGHSATAHPDRDAAAAHLVRCADQHAESLRHRVRAERTRADAPGHRAPALRPVAALSPAAPRTPVRRPGVAAVTRRATRPARGPSWAVTAPGRLARELLQHPRNRPCPELRRRERGPPGPFKKRRSYISDGRVVAVPPGAHPGDEGRTTMAYTPRPNARTPKVYPAGTGRPTERELSDDKVVRTVNVRGTVWEAGKKRAAADKVSISHAIEHLVAAYAADIIDLDAIVAKLEELAAEQDHTAN